jgi:hypothetical protein
MKITMKKEEFKQKTNEVIDELAEAISLNKLRALRDSLSSKLEEYDKVADSKWDVVKESAGNFFASVASAWKENFGKVSDAFKKEPPQES